MSAACFAFVQKKPRPALPDAAQGEAPMEKTYVWFYLV